MTVLPRTRRVALPALALLALPPLLAACGSDAPPPKPPVSVAVAPVVRTSLPSTVVANGVVEPMQTAAVASQVSGILTRVAFQEGADVERGQVLFQVDPRPYQAALAQARAALARDAAQAQSAARDAARYAALVEKGYVTRAQADQSAASAVALQATVAADSAALERARLDVANTTIRAPISGRTGGLLVRQGNLVTANSSTPLVVINQIRPILVRFSIPQRSLPDIQRYGAGRDLPVRVTPAEGSGAASEGTLSFVDNRVDSASGTVLLKARFANESGALWPGQFVSTNLQLFVQPDVLVIPTQAITEGQSGSYVFVVDNQATARRRTITPGRTADSVTVVDRGLSEGERVVTDGQLRLGDGSKVVIRATSNAGGAPTEAAR